MRPKAQLRMVGCKQDAVVVSECSLVCRRTQRDHGHSRGEKIREPLHGAILVGLPAYQQVVPREYLSEQRAYAKVVRGDGRYAFTRDIELSAEEL